MSATKPRPMKWKRTAFAIKLMEGGTTEERPGLVSQCGTWGIHTPSDDSRMRFYWLTHIPTGCSVWHSERLKECKAVVNHLASSDLDWGFTDSFSMPHDCRTALRGIRELSRSGKL